METLVETNKSLFSQLRALKASIGCMGGGGGSSKSSSASFSIMCLWFCVGASGDIFYWSHKLKDFESYTATAIAEAGAASDSNHHFQSRTLQNVETDDDSTADSAYNFSAHVAESCSAYSDVCAAYLSPKEKCLVSYLPMSLGDFDIHLQIGSVWALLFWAVLSKLFWTFRSKSTGTLVPNIVCVILGWSFALDVFEGSFWLKLWACSDGSGQNVTVSQQSIDQGL